MNRRDVAKRIIEVSRLEGTFTLRSGETSDGYVDKYKFESDPTLLSEVATHLAELVPKDAEALAGIELGGVPITVVVSGLTGLPAVFVRKKANAHGTQSRAEGGAISGRTVTVIDDSARTGAWLLESCSQLRNEGAKVVTALCVIDYEEGAKERLGAEGIELRALFGVSELMEH